LVSPPWLNAPVSIGQSILNDLFLTCFPLPSILAPGPARKKLKTAAGRRKAKGHYKWNLTSQSFGEYLDKEEETEERNREADEAREAYQRTSELIANAFAPIGAAIL
jgi:hypothetical protein